jgi:DNA-directed RNA polymerase specialized sigma24 family protein
MPHELDQSSLHALLDALGTDASEAGHAYENLRVRLIRFFSWNRCQSPEDLADTALDRLAVKLAAGAEPILDPGKFVAGIARMLLHEQHARHGRELKMLSWLSWSFAHRPPRAEVEWEREDALSHCLESVPFENRQILERYYTGDASQRIRNRQLLAAELGIGINALRNRALRLRERLEDCTSGYLARLDRRDGSRAPFTHKDRGTP